MTQHAQPPRTLPPLPSPRTHELLNVSEAASHLGTPVRFVRRLVAERRIPFYKIGRYVRLDPKDLDQFIRDGRIEPGPGWLR